MLKGILGILLFVFLFFVFLLLLTGSHVIKSIKKLRDAARQAADMEARNYRDETGRQQQQYHYSNREHATQQQTTRQQDAGASRQEQPVEEEKVEIHTRTATGETIIDRRGGRDNRKIFDDSDGDYVEFSEE